MAEIYLDYNKLINSEQLGKELNGITVTLVDDKLRFVGDITEKQAKDALNNHVPALAAERTLDEKLASVGLTIDDLKVALGL